MSLLLKLLKAEEQEFNQSRRIFIKNLTSGMIKDVAILNSLPLISLGNSLGDRVIYKKIESYAKGYFFNILKEDKQELIKISEITNVPKEGILSTIFAEDIRLYYANPRYNFKSWLRSRLPHSIVRNLGHLNNPEKGKSSYGMCHKSTVKGAIEYLKITGTINEKVEELISLSNTDDNYSSLKEISIANMALTEYWKREGFDIFNYEFKNISTFAERVGILETLNSVYMYAPNGVYYDPFDLNSEPEKLFEPGFYSTSYSGRKTKDGIIVSSKKPKKCIPHDDPKIGGTEFYLGKETTFGEIARIFVQSGLAEEFFEKK